MDPVKVAAAFDEWMRRFIEEPQRFAREFQAVEAFNAGTYGETCAAYFAQLMSEAAPVVP